MATEHQEFVARFMADYFAECEEHLVEVRASLLALDARLQSSDTPTAILDDLFRNFHSLKGISAIAEMRDGERLAHEMESYLRVLRSGEARLSADGLDALVDGTNTLERLLHARRLGHRAPSIDACVEQLARVTSRQSAPGAAPPETPPGTPRLGTSSREVPSREVPSGEMRSGEMLRGSTLPGSTLPGSTLPGSTLPGSTLPGATLPEAPRPAAPATGVSRGTEPRSTEARSAEARSAEARSPEPHRSSEQRWTVTFTPSPQLVSRGIKVDTIRERLRTLGQVERAAPRVLEGGGIAFDFVVATSDVEALRTWSVDGVTVTPVDVAGADAPPAPPSDAPPAGETAGDDTAAVHASFVRVDLARLEDLMRHVGDMVVTRSRMKDVLQRIEGAVPAAEWRALVEHSDRLDRQLRSVREGVMRVRMVPVAEIFRRMPFVVRDLARHAGKEVRIALEGQDTEIDKLLVERMADPLLHLVRNAVSHGIETPAERVAAGKPAAGTVRLAAAAIGASVRLEVSDDGRGLDRAAIAARAERLGLGPADASMDPRQLLDLICAPGLSTREEADRASGRGVGMEVARRTILDLGGSLELDTTPGVGTTFHITLPLTLAITDALLVTVGDHTFAVPQAAVREVIELHEDALTVIEANELLVHRGGSLPMLRLARLFGLTTATRPRRHALVIGTGAAAFGLIVDRIAGHREIVVKTITDPLIRVGGVTGVTELGDGRVILILDAAWLGHQLRSDAAGGRGAARGGMS